MLLLMWLLLLLVLTCLLSTDIFEEHGIEAAPYHQEWGLVNAYGNPKPSFRAFELLHQAGDQAAPISETSSGSATAAKAGKYATKHLGGRDDCAVTSFVTVARNDLKTATMVKLFIAAYNVTDRGEDDAPMLSSLAVTAKVCGISAPSVSGARVRRIDTTHANPRGTWKFKQKRVTYPTPLQIAELEEASQLQDESVTLTVVGGCVAFNTTMPTSATVVLDFEF